jgi:2-keto-4-pentenoate hydratase/2-oxohepta-3-ene-1,7-dioic acid hydratase in catechol pathway
MWDSVALDAHDVHILAPLERPRHDLLCLGVNYADHLEETKRSLIGSQGLSEKERAVYFSKRAVRLLGPDEKIVGRLDVDPALDYEVELAVILGRGGRNISADDVESHIFGYSVFNDVSSRGLQKAHGQWFVGKSLDTYAALGPEIVTADELPLPLELDVQSIVNGERRQHSNTCNLIHTIPEIIAELSGLMTLEAGDIIATGTPSGVGMGFQPPRYLASGDAVTCEIESVGSLTNTVA